MLVIQKYKKQQLQFALDYLARIKIQINKKFQHIEWSFYQAKSSLFNFLSYEILLEEVYPLIFIFEVE